MTTADVQDRDARAAFLKAVSQKILGWNLPLWTAAMSAMKPSGPAEASRITLSVFKPADRQIEGLIVLPRGWIVERNAWLGKCACRLAKDFETMVTSSQTCFMLALAFLLIRRIARDYTSAA